LTSSPGTKATDLRGTTLVGQKIAHLLMGYGKIIVSKTKKTFRPRDEKPAFRGTTLLVYGCEA